MRLSFGQLLLLTALTLWSCYIKLVSIPMALSQYTPSGIRRAGDDYQDVEALDVLVEWLEHPDRFRWVRVEDEDNERLDDVTAQRSDGVRRVRQIKFSGHPDEDDDAWSWESLLEERLGRRNKDGAQRTLPSLLKKWADSLRSITRDGAIVDAAVSTNRRAAPDLQASLSPDATVDFDAIAEADVRAEVIRQVGSEAEARTFFAGFRFELDRPSLDTREEGTRRRFLALGGTEHGWRNLQHEVRRWVRLRHEPPPDGAITLAEVRRAAMWHRLQALPQGYLVPGDYVLPSREFHEEMLHDLLGLSSGCRVLADSPGVGKSTYVSVLYRELRKRQAPVIRHHYFLSLGDRNPHRLEHERAAESLMHDLARDHAPALGALARENPSPSDLGRWIEACGTFYAAQGKALIILVDGLDHVWRERRSIEELRKLLDLLLPTPSGVVVLLATQPVENERLPSVVLRAAPREEWRRMPLLDQRAVAEWLRHHKSELDEAWSGTLDGQVPDHIFAQVAEALFLKSRGHPLHLRYSLKALQEQGQHITADNTERLPGCPHDDITAYYSALWETLSDESRRILHLMAACQFSWPRQGIFDCLDPDEHQTSTISGALRQVEHLLVHDPLGLRPFHGSLWVFVETLPEHADYSERVRRRAVEWLRGKAPEHWRWAYLWPLEADLGNEEPLRAGPSRAWAVDAIAKRRGAQDILAITSRATWCALKARDLPRAVELSLLSGYCREPFENGEHLLEGLFFAQLAAQQDPYLCARLHASLGELADTEIATLAQFEAGRGDLSRAAQCFDEIIKRGRGGRRRRSAAEVTGDESGSDRLRPLLDIAALPDLAEVERVVDYAVRNRAQGRALSILALYAQGLQTSRNVAGLRSVLTLTQAGTAPETGGAAAEAVATQDAEEEPQPANAADENADGEEEEEGAEDEQPLDVRLSPSERSPLIRHAALLALEENLDLSHVLCVPQNVRDPFAIIYATLRRVGAFQAEPVALPHQELLNESQQLRYGRNRATEDVFDAAFFGLLANHLAGHAEHNATWLERLGAGTWAKRFMHKLAQAAEKLAQRLLAGRPPVYGWFYDELRDLPRPTWPEETDDETIGAGNAAMEACSRISLDVWSLCRAVRAQQLITASDLEAAFAPSGQDSWSYGFLENWLANYIPRRRAWLDDDAVRRVIEQESSVLETTIESFPTRARRYAALASLATLHHRADDARLLIHHACDNALTHAWHKDMLFFKVLESIALVDEQCYRGGQEAEKQKPRRWLLQMAAPIAAVGDFTDGDHTRHLPRELADTLARVAPDLLSFYYSWLSTTENYYDALHAFRVLLNVADLSDPVSRAIASTAVDEETLRVVAQRAENGDSGAQEVLEPLLALLGREALARKTPQEERDERPSPDAAPSRDRSEPEPRDYPPERFDAYLQALEEAHIYLFSSDAVERWSDQWSREGRKAQVLEVLKRAQQRRNLRAHDEMFDLALALDGKEKAYPFLVEAHREEHGWDDYYTHKGKAERRWQMIRDHYPEKWFDFICDTLKSEHGEPWKGLFIGANMWVRLVEYCLFLGHPEEAQALVPQMVASSLELVSPLNLPIPEWAQLG